MRGAPAGHSQNMKWLFNDFHAKSVHDNDWFIRAWNQLWNLEKLWQKSSEDASQQDKDAQKPVPRLPLSPFSSAKFDIMGKRYKVKNAFETNLSTFALWCSLIDYVEVKGSVMCHWGTYSFKFMLSPFVGKVVLLAEGVRHFQNSLVNKGSEPEYK